MSNKLNKLKLCQSKKHPWRFQPGYGVRKERADLITYAYLLYLQGISNCFLSKVKYLKRFLNMAILKSRK